MFFFNSYKPKIEHIHFCKDSWQVDNSDKNSKFWFTENRDASRIQLFETKPDWSFDAKDEIKARAFFEQQAKDLGGVLVELQSEKICDVPCLSGVFKYHSPAPKDLGMYYVGIFWFPFEKFTFQINFESLEQGDTGMRESAVYAIEGHNTDHIESEPEYVETMEELFEKFEKSEVVLLPSDDKKYDEIFPNHPLSKIRAYMQYFRNNVKFDEKLLKQAIYTVK